MKKNKLSNMKLTSVDLVNRGANQDANIVFYKSDTPPEAEPERHVLKKAFDYLKSLFTDDEPSTISKSDIAAEYDDYAVQLCKSFDSIIDDNALNTDGKTAMLQKSIQEFAAFMTEAAPLWAASQSVAKSEELPELIAKAEIPDNEDDLFIMDNVNKNDRKESEDMDLSNLTPTEQEIYKSLITKANGGKVPPEFMVDEGETKKPKKPLFVPDDDMDDMDDMEDMEGTQKGCKTKKACNTKKGCDPNVNKSDIPEFILNAINKSEEFIKAQEIRELQEVAKKYENLGINAEEFGQKMYELRKSDKDAYDYYIGILDKQATAFEKSGLFSEIGKSGAAYSTQGGDVIAKAESMAAEIRKSAPEMTYDEAMAQVWLSHPELVDEYEGR